MLELDFGFKLSTHEFSLGKSHLQKGTSANEMRPAQ